MLAPELKAKLLVEEARRRGIGQGKKLAQKIAWLRGWFSHPQREFFMDTCPLKAAFCTRRAGKSSGGNREAVAFALQNPGSRQVYINSTTEEARRVFWIGNDRNGVRPLVEDVEADAKTSEVTMTVTFPNESIIWAVGMDNEKAINKLLGGAYHRVWVDEAQKVRFLRQLIEEVLGPAMRDYAGTIALTGTPSTTPVGLFYDVTKAHSPGYIESRDGKPAPGWSVHTWSVVDNPFFGETPEERWERTAAEDLRIFGWTEQTPQFRRSYGPEWVKEDSNYVYAIHRCDNPYTEPMDAQAYVIGVDIGYSPDPFAYVVWGWRYDTQPELFEIESFKQTELLPDEQGDLIRQLRDRYQPQAIVADAGALGKAIVEQWNERYALGVQAADKREKLAAIEMFNGDLVTGRLKVKKDSPLDLELQGNLWLPGDGVKKEDPRTPNDVCDAGLYGYRWARHYLGREPTPEPSEEDVIEQRIMRELEEEWAYEDGFGY